jgi:GT2 family glycosyltransferase
MGFSIIIPVKEINAYIRESIPITLKLDYSEFEIIILPNDPVSEQDLPPYLKDPRVSIIATGRVSPAVKRDIGAKHSSYDYLAFLDDDAFPQSDWLKVAETTLRERQVEALGGPAITPKNSSLGEQASGLFFETLVGGGGLSYRYKPVKKSFFVDDYPTVNLIVSKSSFDSIGGFDNNYWPGEDTKFCLDLVNAGYKILYVPELIVWHHRRELLLPHLKQVGGYGRHRGYFARTFPKTSLRPTYFAPSVFALGNFSLAILSIWSAFFLKIWICLLIIYFGACTIDVFSRTKRPILGFLTTMVTFCSHMTYGCMFLRGLFSSSHFRSHLR